MGHEIWDSELVTRELLKDYRQKYTFGPYI